MRTFMSRGPRGRRLLLAGTAVFALVAAGIAIAGPGPASVTLTSATFYANTVVKTHSSTCTGANNDAFVITDAWYTGTATSSDARLTGPATIHVKSVYDSTTKVGSLKGDLSIGSTSTPPAPPPPPGHFHAKVSAVNVNGTVQGYLDGDAGAGAHFMGSFTATFTAAGGFSSSGTPASIGAGGGTNSAIVSVGGCEPVEPNPPNPHVDTTAPNHPDHPGNPPKGPKDH